MAGAATAAATAAGLGTNTLVDDEECRLELLLIRALLLADRRGNNGGGRGGGGAAGVGTRRVVKSTACPPTGLRRRRAGLQGVESGDAVLPLAVAVDAVDARVRRVLSGVCRFILMTVENMGEI